MNAGALHVLGVLAGQHLWQGAALVLLTTLLSRLPAWKDAETHSWMLAGALVLAVLLPLAVFLPGPGPARSLPAAVVVQATSVSTAQKAVVGMPAGVQPSTSVQSVIAQAGRRDWPAALLLVWGMGTLLALWQLVRRWMLSRRLRRRARPIDRAGRHFGLSVPAGVGLSACDGVDAPMLVGLAHPVILVPQRFLDELPTSTLRHLLGHELAHCARRDTWMGAFEALALALYWWSPPLHLLQRRLDAARERACDERAARALGNGTGMADALLAGARIVFTGTRPRPMPAVGMLATRSLLRQRIEGLLTMTVDPRTNMSRRAVLACLTLVLAGSSLTLMATPRLGPSRMHVRQQPGAASLIAAVRADRPDRIRTLVRGGADIDARLPGDGTALIVAAQRGDTRLVHELLELGASVGRASPGDGNPLIAAAAGGHLAVVRELVAAGAKMDAVVPGDETPLINAARSGSLPVVRYLVGHGADVNHGVLANGREWRTPLNQSRTQTIRDYLAARGARTQAHD